MSPEEVVLSFVTSVSLCERALRTEFTDIYRDSPIAPLMARGPDGVGRREGHIDGFGTYKFHGRGCRFELDSGEFVDFDWKDQNTIFNPWRLRLFAESLGFLDVGEPELLEACRSLVRNGILTELPHDFFTVRAASDESPSRSL